MRLPPAASEFPQLLVCLKSPASARLGALRTDSLRRSCKVEREGGPSQSITEMPATALAYSPHRIPARGKSLVARLRRDFQDAPRAESTAALDLVPYTSSLMRTFKLFSATTSVESVAVAPKRSCTDAVYSLPDCSRLARYCVPATVVE